MNKVKLGFKKINPDAKIPTYAHEGDAGMDVCAIEDVELNPMRPTLVKTGLVAEIPDGYEIQVRPRSGMALKHGITVWNAPGTIDCKYRGEIGVILMWMPILEAIDGDGMRLAYNGSLYKISKGDRIAQLVLAPVTTADCVEVQSVGETDRGMGGFGSTGR